MKKKFRLLLLLALLMTAATSAWAQSTYTLTLASNNTAMGRATVVLQPKYELYDTFTPTSSTEGSKTMMNCYVSYTDGAWINTSDNDQSMDISPSWNYYPQVTIHHVTFYNANNQSVEFAPNDGSRVLVYFLNGNVYKDWEGTQLLISGGITKVEVYGIQMGLPAGVTATETAGVYDVVAGTEVSVAAVAKRHHQFINWSNNATTETLNVTVNEATTLTANFAASPVLTLAPNDVNMGSVEIPRHEGNGFLFEVKAADYAGQQSSIGNYQKFYFNTLPVAENSTVWTNNEDWSNSLMVNPEGFGKDQRRQCRVVFVGPNGETYECDFKNADFAEIYLKSGNTYSDNSGNNLLWEGGVASIECYGPGMMLPDGVDQISENTFSVLAGTKVPAKATAKPRYSFVNWSNNSTEAETTYTMPATAATLTANFAANPTLTLTASPATGGSIGFDFTPTPQTLTVNDGTATKGAVPINLCYLDNGGTRGQHIIPADQLGLMAGATLNSITWYVNDEGDYTSTSNVNVYLKEVENTILTEYVNSETATLVYTGTISYANSQMTVTFSEPYTYQGGNLLVGVDNTAAGNYTCRDFLGVDAPEGSSAGNSGANFYAQSFLPKSTFNYIPALPAGVIANTDGTYSVAAGTLFTLKAKPADNYTLGSWSNNAEVNDNGTQTLTMSSANLTITATFVGQPHGVKLAEGTDDADNWTAKVGDATEFTALPLKDVEEGKTVTLKYNGTKRVKSVTATSDAAPPAPKPIADVNTNDVGKLIGLDGYIYVTKSAATTAGTTAVAVIAYVGSETGDDTYKKGLAIALADESGTMNWSTAKTTCEGKTAVTNAKWCLPSASQWRQMCKANGGNDDNCNGLYTTITTHEGTAWQSVQYWTSTEPVSGYKSYFRPTVDGSGGLEIMMDDPNNSYYARACLVF